MNKLADVDTDALQAALDTAASPKAAKRLMIALAYANGVRIKTLSERYDIPRATVYSWLDRSNTSRLAKRSQTNPGRDARFPARVPLH